MGMVLKMVGGFLVVAGSGGCGWYLAYAARQRIDILRELLQAIVILYGDVEYGVGDMAENMERLSRRTQYFSSFFRRVSKHLDEKTGQSLYQIWGEEMETISCRTRLWREDMALLEELGKNLGNLDRQTQLHTLHVLRERLEHNISLAVVDYRSRARLFRVVGITVGVFTVVLLL